jgi:hypothetical protein
MIVKLYTTESRDLAVVMYIPRNSQPCRQGSFTSWLTKVHTYSLIRLCVIGGMTVLRLRTCIYVYYMLSPKKMRDKMFSNNSTYTNSIYMLSTIVNTHKNTKKTMSRAACFFAMCVFLTQPPQNGNFGK